MDAGKTGWRGQTWGRRRMHWEGETLSAVEVPVTGRDAFLWGAHVNTTSGNVTTYDV